MQKLFIDTSFVQGLYNSNDQFNEICKNAKHYLEGEVELFTTDLILCEIGDSFSSPKRRHIGKQLILSFYETPDIKIIKFNEFYFEKSLELYSNVSDKKWGMTDCFSFVVMKEFDIKVCLTTDKDFEQAGFIKLPFEK